MLISSNGTLVRTGVMDISVMGRNTQGVRLIRVGREGSFTHLFTTDPCLEPHSQLLWGRRSIDRFSSGENAAPVEEGTGLLKGFGSAICYLTRSH